MERTKKKTLKEAFRPHFITRTRQGSSFRVGKIKAGQRMKIKSKPPARSKHGAAGKFCSILAARRAPSARAKSTKSIWNTTMNRRDLHKYLMHFPLTAHRVRFCFFPEPGRALPNMWRHFPTRAMWKLSGVKTGPDRSAKSESVPLRDDFPFAGLLLYEWVCGLAFIFLPSSWTTGHIVRLRTTNNSYCWCFLFLLFNWTFLGGLCLLPSPVGWNWLVAREARWNKGRMGKLTPLNDPAIKGKFPQEHCGMEVLIYFLSSCLGARYSMLSGYFGRSLGKKGHW